MGNVLSEDFSCADDFTLGAHVQEFSYREKLPRDVSLNQLDSLSLEEMLALKTGNTQDVPLKTLQTIFKHTAVPWHFEEDLLACAHSRAKFKITFQIQNEAHLHRELS